MKNITVKVDDETYRQARTRAAELGTSVSAMVREFLVREASQDDDREARRISALEELFREAEARGKPRSSPLVPLTREEIYAERVR